MAGEALTSAFMLGTATLMLGPQASLFDLNVAAHSVGLAKNVTVKSSPSFTKLTQGVKQTLVYQAMTGNEVKVNAEVFEYTGKNLTYATGLDGTLVTATTAASTVLTAMTVTAGHTGTAMVLAAGGGTSFTANDYIEVQIGTNDEVFIRKIVSKSTDTLTLDSGLPVAVAVGSIVRKMNIVGLGQKADLPFLSAKIVGSLANGDEVTLLLPKVQITSGISLAFKTDNFDNIPFELTVFDLVASDTNYAYFQSIGQGMLATFN